MTILVKTEAGREVLASSRRLLTPRQRTLLLLADGSRDVTVLCQLVTGATPAQLMELVENGYLLTTSSAQRESTRKADTRPPTENRVPAEASPAAQHSGAQAAPAPAPDVTPAPPPAAPVRWQRSQAATKLYLMDLVERFFAHTEATRCARLREILREVRDDESLLVAVDMVVHAVHEVVGEDRALRLRAELLQA